MLFLYFRTLYAGMAYVRYLLLSGYMVVGVGIGSKALFAVTQIPAWLENPHTSKSGAYCLFVFYGGLLGAIIGVSYLILRSQKHYNLQLTAL